MNKTKNKKRTFIVALILLLSILTNNLYSAGNENMIANRYSSENNFFEASNKNFNYFGRFNFSNPAIPKVWAAGAYITANFSGSYCEIVVNDEIRYGSHHNYIYINIDDTLFKRVRLEEFENRIKISDNLGNTEHTITILKINDIVHLIPLLTLRRMYCTHCAGRANRVYHILFHRYTYLHRS